MSKPEAATWSALRVATMIGEPPRSVNTWVTTGLVTPESRATSRGRAGHKIGLPGLLEIVTVSQLKRWGFPVRKIRRAVETLRRLTGEQRPLARFTLVVAGEDLQWHPEEGLQISLVRRPGQPLLILPIADQYDELLKRLIAEGQEAQVGNRVGL